MFHTKKFIVGSLERMCSLTRHHYCHFFALHSANLDEKWGTGVWTIATPPTKAPQTGDYYEEL